jgi:hypothetical protein
MKGTSKINMFDRIMMAISFAEENEPETALEILEGDERKSNKNRPGTTIEKRPSNRPTMRV